LQTISLSQQLDAADLRVSISQLRSQNVPLRQRQDSIQRSGAVYEQAMAQNNRVQKLYREGAVSKAQIEQAQADFQVAKADLASAKAAAAAANNLEQEQIKQRQVQHQFKITGQQQQLTEMRGQLVYFFFF
jgi:multidrug resistance efflux pump